MNPPLTLTEREVKVLQHLANGLRQKQVADVLNISKRTVERLVKGAIHKNKILTSTSLVAQAEREGLIK